jgi:hypothetical protein
LSLSWGFRRRSQLSENYEISSAGVSARGTTNGGAQIGMEASLGRPTLPLDAASIAARDDAEGFPGGIRLGEP